MILLSYHFKVNVYPSLDYFRNNNNLEIITQFVGHVLI